MVPKPVEPMPPKDPKNETKGQKNETKKESKPKMRNPFTRIGNFFREVMRNDPDIDDDDGVRPRRRGIDAEIKQEVEEDFQNYQSAFQNESEIFQNQ